MEGGPPCFPPGSTCPAVLWILSAARPFRLRGFYPLWLIFPDNSSTALQCFPQSSTPSVLLLSVWPLPIPLAATLGIDVSFSSSAYLDVSVQRVPSIYLCIQHMVTEDCSAGFPHSEISGSSDICSSPLLIAAYHVFLRLSVPRHPPCALSCLTFHHIVASYDVVY